MENQANREGVKRQILYHYKLLRLRLRLFRQSVNDILHYRSIEYALPPPYLRYRVHGHEDRKGFLSVGKTCADNIKTLLQSVDKNLYDFADVMDFGCGCGRVIRHFTDKPDSCRFYGTDIDSKAIAWNKHNLKIAQWSVNRPLPPMNYPDESFDFIYAISVFTHLDEYYQLAWLAEIKRLLRPGGLCLLTVLDDSFARPTVKERSAVEKGLLFQHIRFKLDGLPDFYQDTYHTRTYIEAEWSKFFKVRQYINRGINNQQDAVLLEK